MLPISNYKNQIIEAVRNHDFTIVCAETGSGKSTQVPQYLADYYQQVIVTEPRIIATKTLAKRVAEEMNVRLGREVGYKTAYDRCFSYNSKILFCTDGLQLVKTLLNKNDKRENVLIIDEVHEWNLNIETLIAWCKFMKGKWNTKVVIMSATLDECTLAKFFGESTAVLTIPGTLYDVEIEERPKLGLITAIVENINKHKDILVFVAGKNEISGVIKELHNENATLLPLHGEMGWREQKKCFKNYSNPKVIVATNVAQTSLTIPDIDVVIDTGKAKIRVVENGIQGLFLRNISQADIMQRKGRAGRTKNGKYILCSNMSIKDRDEFAIPEIQRSVLDRVVLQLAFAGLDAEELKFYHQPDKEAIQKAKKELVTIGALSSSNKITELGKKIVKMPISVQSARMIVEAEKYGVTEQVITIASILEIGSLLKVKTSYTNFTTEKNSDLLAELDVWNHLQKMKHIDFRKYGINKLNFLKVKEHIQKMNDALDGIVEITNNDNRDAVLKSCLCGLISYIYINSRYNVFCGKDGIERRLDRNSCILNNAYSGDFLIGIPRTLEYKGRWKINQHINLISFASIVDERTILELNPNAFDERIELNYSESEDAIEVVTECYFAGYLLNSKKQFVYNHPLYEEFKAKAKTKK